MTLKPLLMIDVLICRGRFGCGVLDFVKKKKTCVHMETSCVILSDSAYYCIVQVDALVLFRLKKKNPYTAPSIFTTHHFQMFVLEGQK